MHVRIIHITYTSCTHTRLHTRVHTHTHANRTHSYTQMPSVFSFQHLTLNGARGQSLGNSSASSSQGAQSLSDVRLFTAPRTVARQAPLSMGFSRPEYWSGLLRPPAGDLSHPGIKPESPAPPAVAGRFCTTGTPGKPRCRSIFLQTFFRWANPGNSQVQNFFLMSYS